MRDIDLAYMAGVIDSDGSIFILRSFTRKKSGLRPWADFAVVLAVSQMTTRALELFKRYFGGCVCRGRTGLYGWKVSHQKAMQAIGTLQPYLRVKQTQAWLAREYIEQRGVYPGIPADSGRGRQLSPEGRALREGYALAMRTANREAL